MRKITFIFIATQFVVLQAQVEPAATSSFSQENFGIVHFQTSCSESVRPSFERAVAMLHSFSYEAAAQEFGVISKRDPECVMAHWGLAMALWHELWNRPDDRVIQQGLDEIQRAQAIGAKTQREQAYIQALAAFYQPPAPSDYGKRVGSYSGYMESLYRNYADDHDAAAFYALSLLAFDEDANGGHNRKQAISILEKVYAQEPKHPGIVHYLIHAYDKPELAKEGLPAARAYAMIAPAAPHALHMPSHIFARLGLWQDDIASNLASKALAQKNASIQAGDAGQQFHAMEFLVYAYLQIGRESEAKKLIQEVKQLSPVSDMYGMGNDPRLVSLASFSADYLLELHRWHDAAALKPIKIPGTAEESFMRLARVIGAVHLGKTDAAREDLGRIERIHRDLLNENRQQVAEGAEQDLEEAKSWLAHAEGRNEEGIATLRSLADKQGQFAQAGDGVPAREMLADLLLETGQPEAALVEYEANLRINPNRFNSLYGAARASEIKGDHTRANSYYSQLVGLCEGNNSSRPELSRARSFLNAPSRGAKELPSKDFAE